MTYTFDLVCPRCGKESQTTTETKVPPPRVNCGDCLMNDTEVVEFKIVRVMIAAIALVFFGLICVTANAETFRNANGQVVGRSVTNNVGTTFYNAKGQQTGRAVTNNAGTTFYNAKGQQTGSARKK